MLSARKIFKPMLVLAALIALLSFVMPGQAWALSVPTDTCADNVANQALATRYAQVGQAKIYAGNAISDLVGRLNNQASACIQNMFKIFSNIGALSDPLNLLWKAVAQQIIADMTKLCQTVLSDISQLKNMLMSQLNQFCIPIPNLGLGLNAIKLTASKPCTGIHAAASDPRAAGYGTANLQCAGILSVGRSSDYSLHPPLGAMRMKRMRDLRRKQNKPGSRILRQAAIFFLGAALVWQPQNAHADAFDVPFLSALLTGQGIMAAAQQLINSAGNVANNLQTQVKAQLDVLLHQGDNDSRTLETNRAMTQNITLAYSMILPGSTDPNTGQPVSGHNACNTSRAIQAKMSAVDAVNAFAGATKLLQRRAEWDMLPIRPALPPQLWMNANMD